MNIQDKVSTIKKELNELPSHNIENIIFDLLVENKIDYVTLSDMTNIKIFNLAKKITIKTLEKRIDKFVYDKIVQANKTEKQINLLFELLDPIDRLVFINILYKEKESSERTELCNIFNQWTLSQNIEMANDIKNDRPLAKHNKIC